MRLQRPAVLVLSFGASWFCVADQPIAERPHPALGDVYEFAEATPLAKCRRWEITALDAGGYLTSRCGDFVSTLAVEHDYNATRITDGSGAVYAEFKPYFPGLSFPLQIGKSWSGRYDGYTRFNDFRWTSRVSCEVKAYEEVEVTAGLFAAYRIVCEDRWSAGAFGATSHSTRWYAPKARTVVKTTNREDPIWDTELTNYAIDVRGQTP